MNVDIPKFRELRKNIASNLYRHMTSTILRAFIGDWFINRSGIPCLCDATGIIVVKEDSPSHYILFIA